MKVIWHVIFFILGLGSGLIIDGFLGNELQPTSATAPVQTVRREGLVTHPVRLADSHSPRFLAHRIPALPAPEPMTLEAKVRLLARNGRLAEALDLAERTRGDESVFGRLVAEVAIGLSEVDPVAAVHWVTDAGFGHRIAQEASVLALFRSLSERDPKRAANFSGMVGREPNDELHALAIHAVAEVWAKQSPADAADWAMTKPDMPSLLITVLEQWSTDDPEEALLKLPNMLPSLSSADGEAVSLMIREKDGIN